MRKFKKMGIQKRKKRRKIGQAVVRTSDRSELIKENKKDMEKGKEEDEISGCSKRHRISDAGRQKILLVSLHILEYLSRYLRNERDWK